MRCKIKVLFFQAHFKKSVCILKRLFDCLAIVGRFIIGKFRLDFEIERSGMLREIFEKTF